MGEKVPHKNTGGVLADIRRPSRDGRGNFEAVNLTRIPKKTVRDFLFAKALGKRILIILGVLAFLGIIFLISTIGETRRATGEAAEAIVRNFSISTEALKNFKPNEALEALRQNDERISGLNKFFGDTHGKTFISFAGAAIPFLREGLGIFSAVGELNQKFTRLAEALADLERNAPRYFQTDGAKLISSLETVRALVGEVNRDVQSVRNDFSELKNSAPLLSKYEDLFGENYIKYSAELGATEKFLDALLALLKSPGERHMIVLFQNAAEARPGGGFAGSYADITIENGQLKNIDVLDISDPEGQLAINVVPPTELKTMTRKWAARDAGWFFDFPTSAETITYFLENSKIYSEKGVQFDALIAMNTYAFQSILDVVGPIPVESYGTVVTSGNFHQIVQREVEAGNDKIAGEPKRILKVMAPLLLEKMKTLSDENMSLLAERVFDHFEAKDIMVYAKNPDMQNFLVSRGMAGSMYMLPNNFFGSYLAVVNANIAGGKTDLFMDQNIEARIDLDTNAGVFTDLTIERIHRGNTQKDAWWKVPNKNFIQIYTNPGSSLVSLKGNDTKNIVSKFDYDGAGYTRLPALEKIELTRVFLNGYQAWATTALGKSVFGTWFNVNAGEKKILEARYQLPSSKDSTVWEGEIFTLIIERQSGVRSNVKVTVSAPLGYNFKESDGPLYIFEDKSTVGRITIPLTLTK